MVNEYQYCPRLAYLEWVQGEWAESADTIKGRYQHRRVDKPAGKLPQPDEIEKEERIHARSITLSSNRLGVIAKLDLIEGQQGIVTPVDYKKGKRPHVARGAYEPERVQLCLQGMLLEEHGYTSPEGILYYAESKERVPVQFDEELRNLTLSAINGMRLIAVGGQIPPPLEDSPKCFGCSLSGICLPDETSALRAVPSADAEATGTAEQPPIRRLYPPRDAALPLYVQEQGAKIGKSRKVLTVKKKGEEIGRARLKDVSQVVLLGNVFISAQALHLLCEAGVPVVHLSTGHWFYGVTRGITLRNAFDREAQFAAAADADRCLEFARQVVAAKGANQRTLLGRNSSPKPDDVLTAMSTLIGKVEHASSQEELLGFEGGIAAHYFGSFDRALKPRDFPSEWDFDGRNRRPPQDPVNALLSFGYAILAKECSVALLAEGLDPWWGLFHQPRHGRPALALDLMEEFRPLVTDSAVLTAVNTGMVTRRSFTRSKAACVLSAGGRKAFLRAFEARMDHLVTHPIFDYRCSWRSVIRVQARLLARWLRGDIPRYPPMRTR